MHNFNRAFLGGLILLGMLACLPLSLAEEDEPARSKTTIEVANIPEIGPWGVDLSGLDRAIRPGDDFFGYANGGWVKAAKIAPDARSASVIERARKNTDEIAADLVADIVSQDWPDGSDEAKFVKIYNAYLDRRRVNRLDRQPIRPMLTYIEAIRSREDLADALGQFRLNIGGLFAVRVRIDPLGGRDYLPSLEPSSLLLGVREVYLRDDPEFVKRREEGMAHLSYLLGKTSTTLSARRRVAAVIELETRLARLYPSQAALRDPEVSTQFLSLDDLMEREPRFDWGAFFTAAGIKQSDRIQVRFAGNLPALVNAYDDTSIKVWRDYLRLRLMTSYGAYLSDPIAERVDALRASRHSVDDISSSVEEKAQQLVMELMPDIVGRAYMRKRAGQDHTQAVSVMAEAIRSAYRRRIQASGWLSEVTKTKAIEKLDAVAFIIGGPPGWNDYSRLSASEESLFNTVYWARQVRLEAALRRLESSDRRAETDVEDLRSHVFFSPLQVGAYYVQSLNAVIIPAGYLRAPLYDPAADMAVNFGALGTTIGHELGHAFDDQGAKYGPDGQLSDWWLPEDRQRFDTRGARLAAEFSTYEAYPGINVNPALTLGESLSDLAGLEVAFEALSELSDLKAQTRAERQETQKRFLLGYAQKRRSVRRPAVALELALVGAHAPPVHRVNGIVPHFDVWYEAYDITPDHALWRAPEDRLTVW